jgi:uncharacterized protein (DUF58 family)
LNQLSLVASRVRSGAIKGERRSSRRGGSVEFADYRNYTPGDDLRRLDWNIYARLERPFIKLFEEQEDLAVYLLVDGSRSMDWGAGGLHKFQYALRLAAGLGVIALASGDQLYVGLLQSGRVAAEFGPARGSGTLSRLFAFLSGLKAGAETGLNASLGAFALKPRRPGLLVLVSDLLDPGGFEAGLRPLLGRGHEAAVVRLLAPDELEPDLAGDLQLLDCETGRGQDVSLDGGLRRLYRERVLAWGAVQRADCRRQGTRYLDLITSQPWDQALLLEMRRAGIVK